MARKRTTTHSSGYTILVVDDQEEVVSSTRLILERAGHQVVTAQGGAEALRLFQPGDIHPILVDYFMPDMTGEEVIHAIRQQDKDVQILLQTGYAGEKPPREMLRTLDIQGYHDKSEGPDQLRLSVDVALKAYRQLQKVRETERLKARLLLKEEVLASLCQAMHLPLQAIFHSSSRLLGAEGLPAAPECRQWTERIQRQTHFLEFLVDDLLNLAKLETRGIQVTPQPLQLCELTAGEEKIYGKAV
jgi:CheY-like chemotaxis protein